MTWYDRKRTCQTYGGDLAVIDNALELPFIHEKIAEIIGSVYYCWLINWHKSMYGNGYSWANGKPITQFGIWFSGYPLDGGGISDCGYYCYDPSSKVKGWVDWPCTSTGQHLASSTAHICKRPQCNPNVNPSQSIIEPENSGFTPTPETPFQAADNPNSTYFRMAKWNIGKNCAAETFLRLT